MILIPIDYKKPIKIFLVGCAKEIHEYYPEVEPSDESIFYIKYSDNTWTTHNAVELLRKGE